MSGWCRVLADNIYVMGHNYEETVQRWKLVLELISTNNLKLSPKKTACFPTKLDLLGWTKIGKHLTPDPHRQNRLAKSALPLTVEKIQDILRGEVTVPFHNRKALKYLQDQDQDVDLMRLRQYLTTAKRPTAKDTKVHNIKRYLMKCNDITNCQRWLLSCRRTSAWACSTPCIST